MNLLKKKFRCYSIRHVLGWSQNEMAEVLNLSRAQYNLIDSGARPLPPRFHKLAQKLAELSQWFSQPEVPEASEVKMTSSEEKELQMDLLKLEYQVLEHERKLLFARNRITENFRKAKLFEIQYNRLVEQNDDEFIRLTVKKHMNTYKMKTSRNGLLKLHKMEAKLAGKKAELGYLKRVAGQNKI